MRTPSAPAATKIRALASPPDQIFVSPVSRIAVLAVFLLQRNDQPFVFVRQAHRKP